MYTVVSRVHSPYTAMYTAVYTGVYTQRAQMYTARTRPCTSCVHGRVHVYTARVHSHVHDRVQAVYKT